MNNLDLSYIPLPGLESCVPVLDHRCSFVYKTPRGRLDKTRSSLKVWRWRCWMRLPLYLICLCAQRLAHNSERHQGGHVVQKISICVSLGRSESLRSALRASL